MSSNTPTTPRRRARPPCSAPVSYQPLTDDEVLGLFEDVTAELSVPLCVYDNPATTRFSFSDELHARVADLPGVSAIKIPGAVGERAAVRIAALRAVVPAHVSIGVSGDEFAAAGLSAGADAWFSVLGGLFPEPALAITRAAASDDPGTAAALSQRLEPLWALFRRCGSVRVVATAAAVLGLTDEPNLPLPLRALPAAERRELEAALEELGLTG
jgi:4-hydroxy-tetrahydrodipicolinate synthase